MFLAMNRLLSCTMAALVTSFALLGCGSQKTAPLRADPVTQRTLSSGDLVGYRSPNGANGWLGNPYACLLYTSDAADEG